MVYKLQTGINRAETSKLKSGIIAIAVMAVAFAAVLTLTRGTALAATCSVPSGPYLTIQSAVNDAGCTTINVAAGTYAEHVTVNRSVVLKGANAGIAGNGVRGAESVITGDATGALQLTADNITVNGFKIMSPLNALNAGIHMSATNSGYLIKNNLITGNQIGIYVNSDGDSTISKNLFDAIMNRARQAARASTRSSPTK